MLHPLVHDDAIFGLPFLHLFHFRLRISIIILIILLFGWHRDAASLHLKLAEVLLIDACAS